MPKHQYPSQIAIEAANIVVAVPEENFDPLGCCDSLLEAHGPISYPFGTYYDMRRRFAELFKPERARLFWWPEPDVDDEATTTARCIALCLFSLILQDEEQS